MSSDYITRMLERDTFLLVKGFALNADEGPAAIYFLALHDEHFLAYSVLFILIASPVSWEYAVKEINQYISKYTTA